MHETNFRPFTYHFVNPIMMYSVYLELIKEYSDDARKLIKQFWSLTRNQARTQGFDVYCEETGVAIISIERLNTGAIVDASASMQTLFLIDKSRIVGQQLTSILPDFAANYLIKTIKSYAKTPTRNLNSTFVTYGKMPDGNFFEVEVNLRLFPRIEKEVKLMVSFKKISQPKPILIVNTEGVILEASEPLGKSLDINLKSTTTAPIKFQEICPEFNRINAAFNQKFGGGGHDIIQSFSSKLKSFASAKFLQNNDSRGTVIMQESLPQRSGSAKRQSNSPSPLRVKRTESYFSNPHGNNSIEARGDICEEYMQGSQIMIMQRIDPSNRHLRREVMHDIQIIPCQINNDIYKILTITQTADEKAQSFHAIHPQPAASKDLIGFVSVGETGESDFADNFTEVDERNPQVIYHKASRSRSIPKSDKPSQNNAQVSDTTNDQKQPAKLLHNNNNEPMERAKLPEREVSISSTSSRTVASVKALKSIFSRETTYTLSQRTFIITVIIAIIMIALGIYNYSLSRSASTQVETGVSIVNLASLRLAQSVRGWQYATRIWLRYLGLRTGQVSTLKSSMLEMGQMMLEYNKQFTEELSSLADQDLFSEIMASNIHLWELDESMTTTGAGTDSVTATTILANKLIYIGNTTLDLEDDYIRELSTYLCNNTCNDYMVYSESLIDATQKMLQNTLSNNISNMQLILGFEIGAVVVLSLLLFISGRLVIQLHQKLFRALVKIDEYYLIERLFQVQKMRTLLLQDIETRGYGLGTLENTKGKYSSQALEKAKSDKSKAFRKGVFQKRSERLVLRRVYIDLLKYIFVSFVFVQIITAIFVISLTQSLASFRNSQSVTNQLSVTAEAAYTSSIAISTVYMDMDFRNTTSMKVRNLSPSSQMTSVMNDISLINNDLTSVFTETGEGITDALIQEIFSGPLCKYLADDTATYDYCITATDNDELGLLALNSKLLSAQEFYVTKYMDTPTYDMAYSILDGYVAIIRPVAEALEGIYNFINLFTATRPTSRFAVHPMYKIDIPTIQKRSKFMGPKNAEQKNKSHFR